MGFFELRTPRDMLHKTMREYDRLAHSFEIDNLFNFFVTAYHIRDYILKNQAVPQATLENFLRDPDLKACHDLCDKGKHLRLTSRPDPTTSTASGVFGGAPFGTLPFGSGTVWLLQAEDRTFDVRELAERVLQKWEAFFAEHGL